MGRSCERSLSWTELVARQRKGLRGDLTSVATSESCMQPAGTTHIHHPTDTQYTPVRPARVNHQDRPVGLTSSKAAELPWGCKYPGVWDIVPVHAAVSQAFESKV